MQVFYKHVSEQGVPEFVIVGEYKTRSSRVDVSLHDFEGNVVRLDYFTNLTCMITDMEKDASYKVISRDDYKELMKESRRLCLGRN